MQQPGNTPLLHCEGLLPQLLGFERVCIKDESENPTGTMKDRRSAHIISRAIRENVGSLVLVSAGNAAYSLAKYAEGTGIGITAVVDRQLSREMKLTLRSVCTCVMEVNLQGKFLNSSLLTQMARTKRREKIWDVTNGFHAAYRTIVDELPDEPDSIVVPRGSGEAMVGIYEAVRKRDWRTTVIGIGSFFNQRLRTKYDVYPKAKYDRRGRSSMITVYCENRGDEQRAIRLAPPVEAEEASKLAMGSPFVVHPATFGKRVIMVNSGKGKEPLTDSTR